MCCGTWEMSWVSGMVTGILWRGRNSVPFPTRPYSASFPPFEMDSKGVEATGTGSAQAWEAGPQARMGGCPSLAFKGDSEGKWVGLGREESQLFELPKQHPLWPQETASQMSLSGAQEGEGGGFSTPVTFTLVI